MRLTGYSDRDFDIFVVGEREVPCREQRLSVHQEGRGKDHRGGRTCDPLPRQINRGANCQGLLLFTLYLKLTSLKPVLSLLGSFHVEIPQENSNVVGENETARVKIGNRPLSSYAEAEKMRSLSILTHY